MQYIYTPDPESLAPKKSSGRPSKPAAPTANRMLRGCYISLRTTFSADLKKQYYRIKVGKGTSGTGGVFGRSGDQGLPVLFSVDYPNAPSRGSLRYHITKPKIIESPLPFVIMPEGAIYDLEQHLIDFAKSIIGESKKQDVFNLSGQTETFGWFKSRKKAVKAAKKIAKALAFRKPTTVKNEKITVYDWIKNKEVK